MRRIVVPVTKSGDSVGCCTLLQVGLSESDTAHAMSLHNYVTGGSAHELDWRLLVVLVSGC